MTRRRAVILGGGGVTGIAWEIGVLKGLQSGGADIAAADAVIGTSAGSFAGTYLGAGLVDEYFDLQFNDDVVEISAAMSPEAIAAFRGAIIEGAGDPIATAKALGLVAAKAHTVSSDARAKVVESRLPSTEWPDRPLMMTAIDADTGVLHLLDKNSGVSIAVAAAASGAVPGLWPMVEALGRKWIDGGSCSAANADLGIDYESVIVIAPAADGFPGRRNTHDEVADLKSAGVEAILIAPDQRTKDAIGSNLFDPTRRGPAAQAGLMQGQELALDVKRIWEST
jgi:NTE family protein